MPEGTRVGGNSRKQPFILLAPGTRRSVCCVQSRKLGGGGRGGARDASCRVPAECSRLRRDVSSGPLGSRPLPADGSLAVSGLRLRPRPRNADRGISATSLPSVPRESSAKKRGASPHACSLAPDPTRCASDKKPRLLCPLRKHRLLFPVEALTSPAVKRTLNIDRDAAGI